MDQTPENLPISPEHTAAPETLPPAPQPSIARHVFFGPFGLRAGWSLLIYIGILLSLVMGVRAVTHHIRAKQKSTPAAQTATKEVPAASKAATKPAEPEKLTPGIIAESVSFGVIFLLSWLMAAIEHRRLGVFGLGGHRPLAYFFTGAFWGLAAMSLLIAMLRGFHLLAFDGMLDHGAAILKYGAMQLVMFLLVGLVEEYLFRGYVQFTLMRGLVGLGNMISAKHGRSIAFWLAAVITSALFFAAHMGNGGENFIGLLGVFFAGMLLVVALWRTGSLWWGIGFHMAWDWAQSFLYGVPDSGGLLQGRLFATHAIGNPLLSGGTAGPEGSLFCTPVLILLILVLVFFTRASPQPPLETRDAEGRPPHTPILNLNGEAEIIGSPS